MSVNSHAINVLIFGIACRYANGCVCNGGFILFLLHIFSVSEMHLSLRGREFRSNSWAR